jgi:hypothetical protein
MLTKIYWLRVALGVVAGLISAAVPILVQTVSGVALTAQITETNTLLNGITIALLVYLISYYIMKAKFAGKVEKPSKIMSMGIFIYFFTWLVVWVLTITIVMGPPAVV